jgi:hypothetical protein
MINICHCITEQYVSDEKLSRPSIYETGCDFIVFGRIDDFLGISAILAIFARALSLFLFSSSVVCCDVILASLSKEKM